LSKKIDVIFIQDPRYNELKVSINEIAQYKRLNPATRVVHRVNECDARKNTNDMDMLLNETSKYTDHTVFVSSWMKDYHLSKGWNCNSSSIIYNGVNTEHFSKREKLNNGKVNIVTHHWSNNLLKGFDVYDFIDDFVGKNNEFTFTYIGRHNNTFKHTHIIDPLHGKSLGEELSKYDIYISGSKFDPGPNHILESLSCRIPTYVISTGGGAVEFAGEDHSYSSLDDLLMILHSKKFSENKLIPYTWDECIDLYIEQILKST